MNTTLLLVCSFALAQPGIDAPGSPEFEGTFSVLVKTSSLLDSPPVVNEPASLPAATPAATAASETVEPLTPVPPFTQSPAAAEVAPASHVEETPAVSLEASVLPAMTKGAEQITPTVRVLHELMAVRPLGALRGHRLQLREALAGISDRHAQLHVVSAYWQLVAAAGRFHVALDRHEQLARIAEPVDARQAARLQAARATAKAALREAELSAVSMQYALADLIPGRPVAGPVVPVDSPFVGPYRTHFSSLFGTRAAPAGMFRIHQILPLRLATIDARAAAVVSLEEAVVTTDDAFAVGGASLEELLNVMTAWQTQREAFLNAVRDYNIDIAAYAFAVATENTNVETLVSMLIDATPQIGSVPVSTNAALSTFRDSNAASDARMGPTLATEPPPWQTEPTAAAHAVPVTAMPATERVVAEPSGAAPAILSAEQSEATPFRDVTPATPAQPEVLVPTPPVRYRSFPSPTQTPSPAAGFTNPVR